MAGETVLESFLIKLGYQVDQASQKSFTTAIGEGITSVMKFASAVAGLAVAVEEAVRRTAFQLARLEFSARMGGVASESIRQIGTALQSVGGNYESVIKAQEQLNQSLQRNPWMRGYAEQALGGHAATIENVINEYHRLASQFGETSQEVIKFRIQMEDVLHIDMTPAILAQKDWAGYQKTLKDAAETAALFHDRWDKSTKASLAMYGAWSRLTNTVDTYYKTMFAGLESYAAKGYDALNQWLKDISPQVNSWFDEFDKNLEKQDWEAIGRQIGDLIIKGIVWAFSSEGTGHNIFDQLARGLSDSLEKEFPFLKEVEDYLNNVSKAGTPEYRGPWESGGPSAGGSAVPHFQGGGIVGMLHHGEMVLPKPISDGLQAFYGGGGDSVFDDLNRWLEGDTSFTPVMDFVETVYTKLTDTFEEALRRVWPDADKTAAATAASTGAGPGPGPGGGGGVVPTLQGDQRQQQAMDYFVSQGWSKEQAAGIVANLSTETGGTFDPNSKGDSGLAFGVGQWHPGRQANFAKVFGHPIQQSTYAEQLAFVDWELRNTEKAAGDRLRQQTTAAGAGGSVSQYYERPLAVDYNMRLRGALAGRIAGGYQPGGTANVPSTPDVPVAGGGNFSAAGKADLAHTNARLVEALKAAAQITGLPINVTEAYNPGGHVAGSAHHSGMAIDFRVGNTPNEGAFGGAGSIPYAKVAHAMYNYLYKKYGAETAGALAWGGEFETKPGSGVSDWMHVGFQGRGRHRRNDWAYVDNSQNTTVVNGVTNYHEALKYTQDKNDSNRKRNQKTVAS